MRLSFKNKATPENIRVKIVAKSNSSIKIIGDVTAPGNNPTMVLNDGELVFCLAPVITQGVWALNPEFNITNGIVTYSAYKNVRSTKYFSHANLSLLEPVIRSFQDEGMQEWKATRDAVRELTGTNVWVFDKNRNIVTYENQGSKSIPFQDVAQKIIDNAKLSDIKISNSAILYLQEVAKSIYNPVQFITKDELLLIFEENIVRVSYKGVDQEHVVITAKTTSALDFEKGLIDRIPTINWELSGSNTIQNKNVLFSNYSIETKNLGDSLYTNSKIITGGSTPFTLEFYALLKGGNVPTVLPLFTKNKDSSNGDQGYYLNINTGNLFIVNYGTWSQNEYVSHKIKINEFNKITFSFDGAALRNFINDEMNFVVGISNGFDTSSNQPFNFLDNYIPSYAANRAGSYGIIDNINIFDGEARIVRNKDPFEGNLIVDLSCEGQHNSTKLIDNGLAVPEVKDPYWDNVVVLLDFENGLNDKKGNVWTGSALYETTTPLYGKKSLRVDSINNSISSPWKSDFAFKNEDFTIEVSLTYSSTEGSYPGILTSRTYGSAGSNWSILLSSGKVLFESTGLGSFLSNTTLVVGNTYHIAVVRKGIYLYLFINGVLEKTITLSPTATMGSVTAPLNIGSLDAPGQSYNCVRGFYDEVRITKGIARYTENYIVHTEPFYYKKQNKWTTSGNAVLSTSKPFSGFSSLYIPMNGHAITSDPLPISDGETFTMSFSFSIDSFNSTSFNGLVSNNVSNSNQTANRFQICHTTYNAINSIVIGYVGSDGTTSIINTVVKGAILPNVEYKLDVIFQQDKVDLYLNNRFDNSTFVTGNNEYSKIFDKGLILGGFAWNLDVNNGLNGYIKNFKIYKGISVIPESPLNKIQLKFDNNLKDDCKTSTWTDFNLTYNQLNSVSGYCAEFNTSSSITSKTDALDFGEEDFKLSYDCKSKDSDTSGKYVLTNDISYMDSRAMWFFGAGTGWDYANKPINTTSGSTNGFGNQYYNFNLIRKGKTLHTIVNDVVVSTHNLSNQTFDLSKYGSGACLGRSNNFGIGTAYNGYLDNFNSIKGYEKSFEIQVPAVELPFYRSSKNTGYIAGIISTDINSPVYSAINGKDCIKTENNKYVNISATNALNVSNNIDFYMELEFYKVIGTVGVLLSDMGGWLNGTTYIGAENGKVSINVLTNGTINDTTNMLYSSNTFEMGTWNTLKLYRKGNVLSIDLNGVVTQKENYTGIINFSKNGTCFGTYGNDTSNTFNGYLRNFRFYLGRSKAPEKYNPYRVLDIDFKPTKKSFTFKDNNNRSVVHSNNLPNRNYLNSKYCCTFNGIDQYLLLGNNPLLNFDKDNFVINIKFEINSFTNTFSRLLSNNIDVSSVGATSYIMITGNDYSLTDKRNKIFFGLDDNTSTYVFSEKTIQLDTVYDLKIVKKDGVIDIFIDDQYDTSLNSSFPCNFNQNSNTYIGTAYASNTTTQSRTRFNGTIYSVKVLRNTSDVTLLEDVWVDPFPEPEVPPFEEGVLNFTELLKDIDPSKVVLDFKQLRYP